MNFELGDFLNLIGTGAMLLAVVWNLSGRLTRIESAMGAQNDRITDLENDVDRIAPRPSLKVITNV